MPEQRKRLHVLQRLGYQRPFYLRPKFRQWQRLLGSAYTKSATPKLMLLVARIGTSPVSYTHLTLPTIPLV